LEGLVKTRLEKKERRKQARLVFKAEERQRKLEDVRARQEERLQKVKGRRVQLVKQIDSHSVLDAKDQAAPNDDATKDSSAIEQPIDPQKIHGGSLAADKFIRLKMIPGDSM
jgi:hypothetical protein